MIWLRSTWVRWRTRRRFRRGIQGEQRALVQLEHLGFTILEDQASRQIEMEVDGVKLPVNVRVDYLVERRGRRGVVEVKTGKVATDPTSTATRRQLLEYSLAYDVDEVFLYDAEARRLQEIRFPWGENQGSKTGWGLGLALVAFGAGVSLAWWWLKA